MIYLNRVTLMGYTGDDAKTYIAANSGRKYVKISLATTKRRKDRETSEVRDTTQWHSVVAWGNLATTLERIQIRKGSPLYVEGELSYRTWKDSSGVQKSAVDIIAERVQTLARPPQGHPAIQEDVPF